MRQEKSKDIKNPSNTMNRWIYYKVEPYKEDTFLTYLQNISKNQSGTWQQRKSNELQKGEMYILYSLNKVK